MCLNLKQKKYAYLVAAVINVIVWTDYLPVEVQHHLFNGHKYET